jgi:hypothetical protein
MALFEYKIQYDDKNDKTTVTCRVLSVGGPDKIRFKSNYSNTAIQYVGGTPFDPNDPSVPQADQPFIVGKQTKEFEVKKYLTREKRLHFKCGEGVRAPAKISRATAGGGEAITTSTSTIKLKAWKGGGGDTPPDL